MKVKELIKLLKKVKDKEREIKWITSSNPRREYNEIIEINRSTHIKYVRIYFSE